MQAGSSEHEVIEHAEDGHSQENREKVDDDMADVLRKLFVKSTIRTLQQNCFCSVLF